MLGELNARLQEQYVSVTFTDALAEYVLDQAYSPEFGARPLKRFIQDNIETILATKLIAGEISTEKKYVMDVANNEIVLREVNLSA